MSSHSRDIQVLLGLRELPVASTIEEGWRLKVWDLIGLILLLLTLAAFFLPRWKAPLEGHAIYTIVEVQGTMWLGTNKGAFRIVQDELLPVFEASPVRAITAAQGSVWLATDTGAFRVGQDKPDPDPVFTGSAVHGITEAQGSVWLATDIGAYRVDQGKLLPVVFDKSAVHGITEAQGRIWLATDIGAYCVVWGEPVEGRPAVASFDSCNSVFEGHSVYEITEAQGSVWLATYMGAFRVDGSKLLPVFEGPPIHAITKVQGRVWLASDIGAIRVGDKRLVRFKKRRKVYAIVGVQDDVWLATDTGVYRVRQNKSRPVFEESAVYAIMKAQDSVRLGANTGAYRVVEKKNEVTYEVTHVLDKPRIRDLSIWGRYVLLGLLIPLGVFRLGSGLVHQLRDQKRRIREIADQERRNSFEFTEAQKRLEIVLPSPEPYTQQGLYIEHRRRESVVFGADFYNFVPRTDGSFGIYLVDVEGHGLSAAIQARSLYQALSNGVWGYGDARTELEYADQLVRQGAIFKQENAVFCMNFTEIDLKQMEVRHANAGMPFPLLFRSGEALPQPLQAAGIYVGAGYSRYPVQPARAQVSVGDGDLLVIFSDGILEARNDRGRIFDQQGIIAAVSRMRDESPEVIANEILRAVAQHAGRDQPPKRPEDDQTLAVVLIGDWVEDPTRERSKSGQRFGSLVRTPFDTTAN